MEAIIILAESRPCRQDADFRALYTLPNSLLSPEIADFFGDFLIFSDNTLAAQKSDMITVNSSQMMIILPLVGALEIEHDATYLLGVGEVGFFSQHKNMSIHNLYENDLVNYLCICIKIQNSSDSVFIDAFDLEKNKLVELNGVSPSKIYLGKFDEKKEVSLEFDENKKAFVFVISGVFEVENRLLEARSALAIWNLNKIEFESLAGENIVLVFLV